MKKYFISITASLLATVASAQQPFSITAPAGTSITLVQETTTTAKLLGVSILENGKKETMSNADLAEMNRAMAPQKDVSQMVITVKEQRPNSTVLLSTLENKDFGKFNIEQEISRNGEVINTVFSSNNPKLNAMFKDFDSQQLSQFFDQRNYNFAYGAPLVPGAIKTYKTQIDSEQFAQIFASLGLPGSNNLQKDFQSKPLIFKSKIKYINTNKKGEYVFKQDAKSNVWKLVFPIENEGKANFAINADMKGTFNYQKNGLLSTGQEKNNMIMDFSVNTREGSMSMKFAVDSTSKIYKK